MTALLLSFWSVTAFVISDSIDKSAVSFLFLKIKKISLFFPLFLIADLGRKPNWKKQSKHSIS